MRKHWMLASWGASKRPLLFLSPSQSPPVTSVLWATPDLSPANRTTLSSTTNANTLWCPSLWSNPEGQCFDRWILVKEADSTDLTPCTSQIINPVHVNKETNNNNLSFVCYSSQMVKAWDIRFPTTYHNAAEMLSQTSCCVPKAILRQHLYA